MMLKRQASSAACERPPCEFYGQSFVTWGGAKVSKRRRGQMLVKKGGKRGYTWHIKTYYKRKYLEPYNQTCSTVDDMVYFIIYARKKKHIFHISFDLAAGCATNWGAATSTACGGTCTGHLRLVSGAILVTERCLQAEDLNGDFPLKSGTCSDNCCISLEPNELMKWIFEKELLASTSQVQRIHRSSLTRLRSWHSSLCSLVFHAFIVTILQNRSAYMFFCGHVGLW